MVQSSRDQVDIFWDISMIFFLSEEDKPKISTSSKKRLNVVFCSTDVTDSCSLQFGRHGHV